jgi:Bacterial Ig-like domain (group 2)
MARRHDRPRRTDCRCGLPTAISSKSLRHCVRQRGETATPSVSSPRLRSRSRRSETTGLCLVFVPLALVVTACGSRPSPTTPTATVHASSLSVSGLPLTVVVGATAQLTASVTLSDGTHKEATALVTWQSSEPAVATVTKEGRVTVVGVGEADVSATYQTLTGRAHLVARVPASPPPAYVLSGTVHETAPTEGTRLPNMRIEAIGGALDGQIFATDQNGQFALPPVESAGFALKFKGRGYEDVQFDVVRLPRDQVADIAVPPALQIVTDDRSGTATCDRGPVYPVYAFPLWMFPVHHSGFAQFLRADNIGWGSTAIRLFQTTPNGERNYLATFDIIRMVWGPVGFNAVFPPGGSQPVPVTAGFTYGVDFGQYADAPPCGPVRGIWTHPN